MRALFNCLSGIFGAEHASGCRRHAQRRRPQAFPDKNHAYPRRHKDSFVEDGSKSMRWSHHPDDCAAAIVERQNLRAFDQIAALQCLEFEAGCGQELIDPSVQVAVSGETAPERCDSLLPALDIGFAVRCLSMLDEQESAAGRSTRRISESVPIGSATLQSVQVITT